MWYIDRSDDLPQNVVLQRKADADGEKRLTDRPSAPASAVEARFASTKVMAAAASNPVLNAGFPKAVVHYSVSEVKMGY
jgi:hypothetical protein